MLCVCLMLLSGCTESPFIRLNKAIFEKIASSGTEKEKPENNPENNPMSDGQDAVLEGEKPSQKSEEGLPLKGSDGDKASTKQESLKSSEDVSGGQTSSDSDVEDAPILPVFTDDEFPFDVEKEYAYDIQGDFVNWAESNNTVYMLTQSPNNLYIFTTTDSRKITAYSLPAAPAEARIYGEKLYVSFPALNKIQAYDKQSLKTLNSITGLGEVSSFCIDGSTLYYSEHDQWCKIFRKNLSTGENDQIKFTGKDLFYNPKLELNKKAGLLYIGESGLSAGRVYYCNLSDLSLNSFFADGGYGYHNNNRCMYVYEDGVYWGSFKLNAAKADDVLLQYGSASGCSISFAGERFVCSRVGLFNQKTGKLIDKSIIKYMYSYHTPFSITQNGTIIIVAYNDGALQESIVKCIPPKSK